MPLFLSLSPTTELVTQKSYLVETKESKKLDKKQNKKGRERATVEDEEQEESMPILTRTPIHIQRELLFASPLFFYPTLALLSIKTHKIHPSASE